LLLLCRQQWRLLRRRQQLRRLVRVEELRVLQERVGVRLLLCQQLRRRLRRLVGVVGVRARIRLRDREGKHWRMGWERQQGWMLVQQQQQHQH
jgi:hypothetical protein